MIHFQFRDFCIDSTSASHSTALSLGKVIILYRNVSQDWRFLTVACRWLQQGCVRDQLQGAKNGISVHVLNGRFTKTGSGQTRGKRNKRTLSICFMPVAGGYCGAYGRSERGKETHIFNSIFMLRMVISLPRHARDKHSERALEQTDDAFSAGRGGYPGDQIGLSGGDVCDQRRNGTRKAMSCLVIMPRHVSSSCHVIMPRHVSSSCHVTPCLFIMPRHAT